MPDTPNSPNFVPLLCHPATPAPPINRIDASLVRLAEDSVAFRYCLRGDMARLRIPAERSTERTSLLWEHTCFEAFVGLDGEENYREFNFSPTGQWAAFDFTAYRQRSTEDPAIDAPLIAARLTDGRLELEAVVKLHDLPKATSGNAWKIGLSAVVETVDTVDESHSYWALHHPSPRPDFHHAAGFVARFTQNSAVAQAEATETKHASGM